MFQIEIPRRSQICAHGQEPLEPGDEFYSVLWNGENERQLIRQDYCVACWEKVINQESFRVMRSYWKSKIPLKKESIALPKQRDERAFYLLKEALKSDSLDDQTEAFILALYLARKRLLVLRQELPQLNGDIGLLYEHQVSEELLCVKKFPLSGLQTEKIQLKLATKFKPDYVINA